MRVSAPQKMRGRLLFPALVGHLPLVGVLGAVLAVYLPSLDDYFHGDDFVAFVDLVTKSPGTFLRDAILDHDTNIYWRPLGQIYYQIIYVAFGLDRAAFHLANVIVFLVSLTLLYAFCRRAGLDRMVSLGAVAIFGLFPNHAISVAWVTNGPRVLALAFVFGALLLMQEALRQRRVLFELLAFLAVVLASLSDETALALAPLPVMYALVFDHDSAGWLRRALRRAAPYCLLVGSLVPVQLSENWQDVGGDYSAHIGWHIPEHLWALAAKLALPIQDGTGFAEIGTAQWIAGAVAGAIAVLLLAFGSGRVRLLVLWMVMGLAPFSLWVTPIAPARYVYLAAPPFAILISWLLVSLGRAVAETPFWRSRPQVVTAVGLLAASVLVALGAGLFASITMARNEAFARETENYRILAEQLPAALPSIPANSRIVINYGIWTGLAIWPQSVVQTVYRDPSLKVVNVAGRSIKARPTATPGDVVVYYTERGFIPASRSRAVRP